MKKGRRYSALVVGLALLFASPLVACEPPTPAEFEVVSLDIAPQEVLSGEEVTIAAEVKNVGGTAGTYSVTLTIDGVKAQTKVVKVAPGRLETVSFAAVKGEPGAYDVEVNNLSGAFRILKAAEFVVNNLLIDPPVAQSGKAVTVTADVTNAGEVEDRHSVTLTVDGSQAETKEVAVAPRATETVSFSVTQDATGSHSIEVAGLSGFLIVTQTGDALPGLAVAYPELCQELLRLPDLAEMDDKDNEAIEDIVQLALKATNREAFEAMLDEGIREKRKYCTPLEALLWIAYDREFVGYNPLVGYTLKKLIGEAWENSNTSDNYRSDRWDDFDEVVDRLNAPELVEIYLQNNYTYSYTRGEPEGVKAAEQIFTEKTGACYDHAVLAGYCLKKNGYDEAQGMALNYDRIVRGYFIGHILCVYHDPEDSLYYTVDSVGGRVHGPFQSTQDAAEDACMRSTGGEANLKRYSLHDIDLHTGKYKTTWTLW